MDCRSHGVDKSKVKADISVGTVATFTCKFGHDNTGSTDLYWQIGETEANNIILWLNSSLFTYSCWLNSLTVI